MQADKQASISVGREVFVTDFGIVEIPDAVTRWINEVPYKHKEGGRIHKRRAKDRGRKVSEAVNTLSHIAWAQGHGDETMTKVLKLISKQ